MISKEALKEAVKQAKEAGKGRKFKQGLELQVTLENLDLKKTEERISFEALLPHGNGRKRKVALFAEGEMALRAKEAGADLVLSRAELEELGKNPKKAKRLAREYDVFLAQPDLMPLAGRLLGRILGPRDKIPKPLPPNVNLQQVLERYRKLLFLRTRDQPAIRARIGSEEMPEEKVAENALSVLEALETALQKGKGRIKAVYLKTTMGKPVKLGMKG
ncbi:MAG: 50S ribosomal protein L1 [Candidatus Hadarchaeales archaeon]